jgi:hypothetical protein
LADFIVLLIVVIGFAGIGYAVGGITGALWVTLIGLILFGLLYAWPSLTSGAEQTGMGKIIAAPFALIASIVLFIPARHCRSVPPPESPARPPHGHRADHRSMPTKAGQSRSFFHGRWTDATTFSLFLVNAVVALIIAAASCSAQPR